MTDEPRIINTEEGLKHARALETSNDLDAMAATIRALWKERDALTNLGCKAVDLTTEISEGAGKEIAELRAMVDTKIEQVVTLCRGEADAVFIKTPHAVPLGTIDRIGKRLREKLGEDIMIVLLEGNAEVGTLNAKEMRERGWVRSRNSFPEYPREIVCEGCSSVVAFGPATLRDDSPIIATRLIRPDGTQPRDSDPLCLNCGESSMGMFRLTGGGPFTVRDRARTCLHCGGSGVGLADSGDVNAPPCACCGGDGKIDAGGFHTVQDCPTCDGSGHVPGDLTDAQRKAARNGADPIASPAHCPTCNGRGRMPAQADRDAMVPPCSTCKGTGKILKE